jgi:hypothetical protein
MRERIGGLQEREPRTGTSQESRRLLEHREQDADVPVAGELRPLALAFLALARAVLQDEREEDEE